MRFKHVLAAAGVAMVGALTVGCGEDSTDLPDAADSSSAPSTAEQEKAAVGVVKQYQAAEEAMHASGDPAELVDVATDGWAEKTTQVYRKNTFSEGNVALGKAKVTRPQVKVDGETATVNTCLDGSRLFVAPKGTEAIGPDTEIVARGGVFETTYSLVLDDGAWKVDELTSDGEEC